MTLKYNLIMVLVDVVALVMVWRIRNLLAWLTGVACSGMIALALAIVLGGSHFVVARLAAYGLFFHVVVVLLGTAYLFRRKRALAIASGALGAGLIAAAAHAFLLEPTWLEVSYVRVASKKIERKVRIVVLADLQTDQLGDYERKVLRQVLQQQPDVILLAGDYVQTSRPKRQQLVSRLNAFLRKIDWKAPQGIFAVRGNIDGHDWPKLIEHLDARVAWSTQSFELDQFRLTCLGLFDSYNPELRVEGPGADRFHLVLGHVPNFALGEIDADLLVAGHTHGGQVRFPFIGPLTTHSLIPKSWTAGLTELSHGGKLLVSRGIGVERAAAPRLRFGCRPELVVVDLVPE